MQKINALQMDWSVFFQEWWRGFFRDPVQLFATRTRRHCPICGFHGVFINAGRRQEARCPNCSSKERDRTIGLFLSRSGFDPRLKNILHFSAERPFFRQWKKLPGYVAGDIKKSRVANATVDITDIQFPYNYFDTIICNHVLEHVPDDKKGMAECFRVLKKGGTAFFSVPMNVEQEDTWYPPSTMPKEEIERICGWDHLRIYGRDFSRQLEGAGFMVSRLEFSPEEKAAYRLSEERDEMIFMAQKP